MTSSITAFVAGEHAADLRRAAQHSRRTAGSSATAKLPAIELRPARAGEARLLTRLAELDDAPGLEGPVLLALIDGEAQAGLSLRDGRVTANPFVRTQEAVDLLRMRAARLTGARTPGRRLSRISARLAGRDRASRLRAQARTGG